MGVGVHQGESSNGVGRKGEQGCPKGDPNPEEVGVRRWGFERWAPEGWWPKISHFFPSPAAKFVLFFPFWGSSRGILVVFLKRYGDSLIGNEAGQQRKWYSNSVKLVILFSQLPVL